jgi:hypothetical protein
MGRATIGPGKNRLWRLRRLEIRDQAVLFPIAIASRVEAAAATGFLGQTGIAIALGAAGRGFSQGAFGRWRQRTLFARLALSFGRILRVGWHRL